MVQILQNVSFPFLLNDHECGKVHSNRRTAEVGSKQAEVGTVKSMSTDCWSVWKADRNKRRFSTVDCWV